MEQVQYAPSPQSSSSAKTKTICFAVARNPKELIGNPFFSDVLCGISDAAKLYGYHVQFSLFHTMQEQIESCFNLYKQKQVNGFIFTGLLSHDKDLLLRSMQEKQLPFVLIGSSLRHNIFSIHNDNIRDSYMATKYLIDQGYRNILFLTPNAKQDVMNDRIHGYRRAVEEFGLDGSSTPIVYCGDGEKDISDALEKIQRDGVSFDAIMTMENIMSLSALKYCQSKGMKVPEEVGILCFNNAPYLDKISPSITCVDLNPTLLGIEACKLLFDLIEQSEKVIVNKSVKLPSEIIVRETTKRIQQ